VLEHIWQPAEFLQNLRETICDHEVPLYFEVPNVSWIFERAAFWDIFYEHCNYFSADSIERLFAAAGFGIKVIEESFAGQYLSVEVFSDKARRATMSGSSRPTTAAGFTENFGQRQRQLQAMIDSACGEGKSVAIWGAAAKGSTFLNSMQPSSAPVKFVIDINPKKQGCYIAGTGHRIVGPHHLQNDPVDIIFLMNPNYLDEVRSLLADAHCQLICI
jgi:hypothetical protein